MPLLQMYLGKEFVDATFITARQLELDGYVEGACIDLLEKNEDVIHLSEEKPSFFVEVRPAPVKKLLE